MGQYKKIFLFLIVFILIGCGKNKESEEHQLEQKNEPSFDEHVVTDSTEMQDNQVIYDNPQDSIKAVKHSILREKKYKKMKMDSLAVANVDKPEVLPSTEINAEKPKIKKSRAPSFVYIKKILTECETGVTMTQEDLEAKFKIPKEAIKLVKSVTKVGPYELDVKWKSTWLVEKVSDAKFNDGKLKVRFEGNKMYTSGGAISIKYEKKLYSDLVLIGRSAHIPTVKGFYWQLGND